MTARHTLRALAALSLLAGPLAAQYQPYYSDSFSTIDMTKWVMNGTVSTNNGLVAPSSAGNSLISSQQVPGGTSAYAVRAVIHLTTSGGTYTIFAHASNDATTFGWGTGAWYAYEMRDPAFDSNGVCSATFLTYKRVNGVVTVLEYKIGACKDGMVMQLARNNGAILWGGEGMEAGSADGDITTGQPGVGLYATPSGNSIASVQFFQGEITPPPSVNAQSIALTAFPTRVEFQWQGVTDTGIGLRYYLIQRNGDNIALSASPQYTDDAVYANSTYNYTITPGDKFGNWGQGTTVTVQTPPAGAIDPRQVGVRPLGAYWGGQGEQIDLRSGNLNLVLPLIAPKARGGWSVPIVLSYNSQLWRQDPAGGSQLVNWKIGRDVGYGFGWKLLAGSIAPSYYTWWSTVHHYTYTDASGAEYRLDVNNNGIWTSHEGIYLTFDSNTNRLYFRDGTFWAMDCQSGGSEEDAGTLYPTIVQDTNGNQIRIHYLAGADIGWAADTSARITSIEEIRGTYTFTYTQGPNPHLTGIANTVGTAENYAFTYFTNQPLASPFSPPGSFGNATLLQSAGIFALNMNHNFWYNGAGEVTQMQQPLGAQLQWDYGTATYNVSRSFRQVTARRLYPIPNTPGLSWAVSYDASANDPHSWTTVTDSGAGSVKRWEFQTQAGSYLGLTTYTHQATTGGTVLQSQVYTWASDPSGNPYVGSTTTTLDPGTSYAVQRKSEQTLDLYGNVTLVKQYDYGNLTAPSRQFTYGYLHADPTYGSNYISRYIVNRRTSATAQAGAYGSSDVWNYDYNHTQWDATPCVRSLDPFPYPQQPPTNLRDPAYDSVNFNYRGNFSYHWGASWGCAVFNPLGTQVYSMGDMGDAATTPATGAADWLPGTVTPGGISSLTTTFGYSAFLSVSSVSSASGSSTGIVYDGIGRPTSVTSPDGATTNYSNLNSPGNNVLTATINGRWKKTTTDGLGRTVREETGHGSTNDPPDSVVETQYIACACSASGKLWRVSRPHAPGVQAIWTTYTYDVLGRTLSVTVPDGSANGSTTWYVYQGNTTKVTDPANKEKTFTYDAFGNLVAVKEPNPNNTDPTPTNVAVGKSATQSSTLANTPAAAVDGNTDGNWYAGSVTHTNFEPNAWWQVDLGASYDLSRIVIWNRTDCCSDRLSDFWVFASNTPFNSNDTPATLQNRAGTWSNRQLGTPNPSVSMGAWGVQARYVRVQLSGNNALSLAEVQVFAVAANASPYYTSYAYDPRNQLRQVWMPRGGSLQTRTFVYDGTRLTSATNPENGTVTYNYDNNNRVTGTNYADGTFITYSYDSAGRRTGLTQKVPANPPSLPPMTVATTTWNYDTPMDQWPPATWGRLAGVIYTSVNGTGLETYGYNQAGRVTTNRLIVGEVGFDMRADYQYDNEGRLTYIKYPYYDPGQTPQPMIMNFTYDAMGRQAGVTGTLPEGGYPGIQGTATYNLEGRLNYVSFGAGNRGGMSQNRGYNTLGQVTSVGDMTYLYDTNGHNNGRITGTHNSSTGEDVRYTYDALNRLSTAQSADPDPTWGQLYEYDGFGNLVSKTVTKGSAPSLGVCYDANNHECGASYDGRGNWLGGGAQFDVLGRATSIGNGTLTDLWLYNPSNKRIYRKQSGAGDPRQHEVVFYAPWGQKLSRWVFNVDPGYPPDFGPALERATFAGQVVMDERNAVSGDRLGSVGKYFPWGEPREGTVQGRINFATYTRDTSANYGQDYADQRYYSFGTGRFWSPDPYKASAAIQNPQSWNRYAYVQGDPINHFDPRGLMEEAPDVRCVDGFCSDGGGDWGDWDWDPVGYVWAPGSGGGGGGGNGFQDTKAAKQRAAGALDIKDCFNLIFGKSKWNTVEKAKQQLDMRDIAYRDLGAPRIVGSPAKWAANVEYGGNNGATIFLNNRLFPDADSPKFDVFKQMKSTADLFNHTYNSSLTGIQVEQAVVLHELWHIAGGTPDAEIDSDAKKIELITTCIK